MKRGERPTVSTYIGVIILFFINGIITPFHFSSLTLVSALNEKMESAIEHILYNYDKFSPLVKVLIIIQVMLG